MTIYDIKRRVKNAPFFFSVKTMKFFHQTLKSFKVSKLENGNYFLRADMKDNSGRIVGQTTREFDPTTNIFI